MKKSLVLFVAAALIGVQGLAQAADVAAGKAKAMMCAACHGPAGVSSNPMYPNLAGQKANYIVKQLKDFKSGARSNSPLMPPMAKSLSDSDMENVAAYFSSLKP
jgi:cytochrome c553